MSSIEVGKSQFFFNDEDYLAFERGVAALLFRDQVRHDCLARLAQTVPSPKQVKIVPKA